MAARLLGVAGWPLRLSSRFLGGRTAGLGLGSSSLRLCTARLCLRRRLLGLLDRPSGRAVCPGLFRCGRVRATRFLLFACNGDRPWRVRQRPLLAAAIPTLLLRRLLRRKLPSGRILPLVFVQLRPLWLRSDLRSRALATSSGRPVGAPRRSRLPEPPRSRGCPTAAHLGGSTGARGGVRRAESCGGAVRPIHKEPEQSAAIPARGPAERQRWVSMGKRCSVSATSGKSWKPQRRLPSRTARRQFAPARVPLPRSPFVAGPVTDLGKGHAPPQMYEAPKPDLRVEARPRVNQSAATSATYGEPATARHGATVAATATAAQPQPRPQPQPMPNERPHSHGAVRRRPHMRRRLHQRRNRTRKNIS